MGKRVYSIITTLAISINALVPISVHANEIPSENTSNIENNLMIENTKEDKLDSILEDESTSSVNDTNDDILEKEENTEINEDITDFPKNENIDNILPMNPLEEVGIKEELLEQENIYQESKQVDVLKEIEDASNWTLENVKNPGYEDEWNILGISRGDAKTPEGYYDTYYKNLETVVKEKQGNLHRSKYTEYSRVIIALASIGKDPTNVGGYNLVEKLYDYEKISKQGINGTIFALIALDTKEFEIPESANNSREKLIDGIISNQLSDGGFNLTSDKGDVDITAMAVQALAKYKHQGNVKESLDKAITFLSDIQLQSAGYGTSEGETVESSAQVLVALNALDIDVNDERFIKNGKNIIDAIMKFKVSDGGFKHLLSDTTSNSMATEQVLYSLVSQNRSTNNKTRLYDMSDVNLNNNQDSNVDNNQNSNNNNSNNNQGNTNQNNNDKNDNSNNTQGKTDQNNNSENKQSNSHTKNEDTNNLSSQNSSKVKNPKTSDSSILGFVGLSVSSIMGLILLNKKKIK